MDLDIPILLLIFIGIGMLVVAGLAVGAYSEKKRREALQRVAEELGLTFYRDADPGMVTELSDLPLFSKGRSKRITNLIHGETEDVMMGVFDYRYTTGSGKNAHTYRQSVAFFSSDKLRLPVFEMRPQSFFHGIGKVFGYQDIDFDSHPLFSKAFVLRGPNEEHVRRTFRPGLLTSLEQKQGVCIEGQRSNLVFYRPNRRVNPARVKELMNEGFEVFVMFRKDAS